MLLFSLWSPEGPLGTFSAKIVANKDSAFSGGKTLHQVENLHFLRNWQPPRTRAAEDMCRGAGEGDCKQWSQPCKQVQGQAGAKHRDDFLACCVRVRACACARESAHWWPTAHPPSPASASPVFCAGILVVLTGKPVTLSGGLRDGSTSAVQGRP